MNVLMLGWEFTPNISGGLGTACEGIVKGLSAYDDLHVLFVVPKSSGKENTPNFKLIDVEKVAKTGNVACTEILSSNIPLSKYLPDFFHMTVLKAFV